MDSSEQLSYLLLTQTPVPPGYLPVFFGGITCMKTYNVIPYLGLVVWRRVQASSQLSKPQIPMGHPPCFTLLNLCDFYVPKSILFLPEVDSYRLNSSSSVSWVAPWPQSSEPWRSAASSVSSVLKTWPGSPSPPPLLPSLTAWAPCTRDSCGLVEV